MIDVAELQKQLDQEVGDMVSQGKYGESQRAHIRKSCVYAGPTNADMSYAYRHKRKRVANK